MVKIVKAKKPYTPHGDIAVYGGYSEYLEDLDWDELSKKNPMPIVGSMAFSLNPWHALINAGIDKEDVEKLKTLSTNYCPCTQSHYFSIVPIAILTDKATVYTSRGFVAFKSAFEDAEWNRESWKPESDDDPKYPESHLGSIHRAMLGSGYNDCILPSDGSHNLEFFTIPLDNGDRIILVGWEWYNK